MKNIILIGMMGCGKTTCGQLLASSLGRELVDTDAFIEAREGRSITDIFARDGEEYFRGLELAACRELSKTDGLVIACGGGLPLRPDCIRYLKQSGLVFWLDRDPGETYDSLDTSGRPLAQEGREAFLERYRQREPIYRQCADYLIQNPKSPQEAVALISTIYSEVCNSMETSNISASNPSVRLCVIGDPVAHSLSPRIQTAMLSALGAAGTYIAQPVKREELADFLVRVRAGEFTGFNATMPHKQDLVPMMDTLDESARLCQAVNTVCLRDGKLMGYSTDGDGFVAALRQLGCDPAGKKIVMLGAGGAARSVAVALARAGAGQVAVCARNRQKAADLCAPFPSILTPAGFDLETLTREAGSAQVLVNCTNLGMTGQGQFEDFSFLGALPGDAFVCDLIYEPAETELLRLAREQGHKTMNGLPLLVWQGVLALEKFLGQDGLDKEVMARAAFDSLKD